MDKGHPFFEVKWKGYSTLTWEPACNLPKYIIDYFEQTGNSKIPIPRIKHTKNIGNSKYHLLTWEDNSFLPQYYRSEDFVDTTEDLGCNTKKDKV